MSDSTRSVTVHRVRAREPWRLALFAVIGLPVLVFGVGFALSPLLAGMLFGIGFQWLGFILFAAAYACWIRAQRLVVEPVPRSARVADGCLSIDGAALPRATITGAYVSPSWPNGAYIRLIRRGAFATELWTDDVEGAHQLVAALELDEKHVVGQAEGSPIVDRTWARVVGGLVALALAIALPLMSHWLGLLLPLLFIAYAVLAFVSRVHVVGADGVVTRHLGRRLSFVPIDSIAAVEPRPGFVSLTLRDGTTRELVVSRHIGSDAPVIGLQVSMLAERIRGAMRRAGTLEVDDSALARNGRDIPAWLNAVRDLARGTGYRAAVQREDLVFLVEDAHRRPDIRIAAAIALGDADPHERARVRIAASSSSLPEVRDALEAALEADDERVSRALAVLEPMD